MEKTLLLCILYSIIAVYVIRFFYNIYKVTKHYKYPDYLNESNSIIREQILDEIFEEVWYK